MTSLPSEWPDETVGLEKCEGGYQHGIYRGVLIHSWDYVGWCIVALDGGVDGLNVKYEWEAQHHDCSTEERRRVSCGFSRSPPFDAIDAAWDSPRDNVAYKVTDIPA